MMTTRRLRAALMSRVSSEDQARGYSLGVQAEALQKYCERNNIEIVHEFREDHSAKDFERPAFKKFLSHIKTNRGKIDLLLFTTWDRFSRNIMEALNMIKGLSAAGITAQAIEQPIDLSIPENKAMLTLYLVMPEIDNDRRSIKIKGGIRGALKSGRYPYTAPIGFKNARDEQNKPTIVPSTQAYYVQYLFEGIANGIPQAEMKRKLDEAGVKIPRSSFSHVLRNVAYIGKIIIPAQGTEEERIINGVHQPLISEELFYRVQKCLQQNKMVKNKPNSNRRREELPLRGNLVCSKCNGSLTGSASKSRNGERYHYYHCNHCHQERFPAGKVNSTFENILKSIKLQSNPQELYKKIFEGQLEARKDKKRTENPEVIKKRIQDVSVRIDNIQDLLADKKLSWDDFNKMKTRYVAEKEKLEKEIQPNNFVQREDKEKILRCLEGINRIEELYLDSDLGFKQRLSGSTFPEKFSFDGKKCRTARINEVIRLAVNADKALGKKKTGQLTQFLVLSGLVDIASASSNNFAGDLIRTYETIAGIKNKLL